MGLDMADGISVQIGSRTTVSRLSFFDKEEARREVLEFVNRFFDRQGLKYAATDLEIKVERKFMLPPSAFVLAERERVA